MVKLKIDRDLTSLVCNDLRRFTLDRRLTLKPIAYQVGENSSLISAGKNVIEDMISFTASLERFHYVKRGALNQGEIIKVQIVVKDVLKASDFESEGITLIANNKNTDLELLHLTPGASPIDVYVYFRVDYGAHTKEENELFLAQDGYDVSTLVVLTTNHRDIKHFCYDTEQSFTGSKSANDVSFRIEAYSDDSELDILKHSILEYSNYLKELASTLE